MTVTLNYVYSNPERAVTESFSLLKGGFMRYQTSHSVIIASPNAAWIVWPQKKEYEPSKPAAMGVSQNPFLGMPGLFGDRGMNPVGPATEINWHGHPAYQVELDASRTIPKHPHLNCFFARDTKLPLGFTLTQLAFRVEVTYDNLRLNPPLKPSDFVFRPGPGWKKAKSAG